MSTKICGKIYFFSEESMFINEVEGFFKNFIMERKLTKSMGGGKVHSLSSKTYEFKLNKYGEIDDFHQVLDFLEYFNASGINSNIANKEALSSIFSIFSFEGYFSNVIPIYIIEKLSEMGLSLEIYTEQGSIRCDPWRSVGKS